MCKGEFFKQVLDVVSEVTGIAPDDIIKSRKEECTDARYILVKYLYSKKMTPITIGEQLGRTRQGVGSILRRGKFQNWLTERNWEETVKQLASKGL